MAHEIQLDLEPEIKRLVFPGDEAIIEVGEGPYHVDRIAPFPKDGPMGRYLWFRVIKDNKIISEINSIHVEAIIYEEMEP